MCSIVAGRSLDFSSSVEAILTLQEAETNQANFVATVELATPRNTAFRLPDGTAHQLLLRHTGLERLNQFLRVEQHTDRVVTERVTVEICGGCLLGRKRVDLQLDPGPVWVMIGTSTPSARG